MMVLSLSGQNLFDLLVTTFLLYMGSYHELGSLSAENKLLV